MSNSVVIKGNRQGIMVVLDENADFQQIKVEVKEKFKNAAKFFGNAEMALGFDGKKLDFNEKKELISIISENSDLNIVCLIDEDEQLNELFSNALDRAIGKAKEEFLKEHLKKIEEISSKNTDENVSQNNDLSNDEMMQKSKELFYKGTLRSGQVLESEGSVVVLGDVNPGGTVISKGNVIILGSLKGSIVAGADGNEDCFVVALEMSPMQIKIGEVIARSSDSEIRKKKDAKLNPKISYVENGNIYIEELSQEVFDDIRI